MLRKWKWMVVFVVAVMLAACIPFGVKVWRWGIREVFEHFTYRPRFLRSIPESNGIPRLYINTKSGIMVKTKDSYVDADYAIYLEGGLVQHGEIGVKGHGNTTWDKPKKSYMCKFDEETSVLGLPAAKKWILLNPYNDKSLVRNDYAYHIASTIYTNMKWTPHLVDVEVVMNDRFLGVYQLAEKVDLGPGRVDVGPGGVVMEFSRREDPYLQTDHAYMMFKDPRKHLPKGQIEAWTEVIERFEENLYAPDFGSYRRYFDVPSFIDWYLVNEFTKNHDAAYGGSTYWYYDPADDVLHFGPVWDFDISCGNIDYDGCEKTDGFFINQFPYFRRMIQDPGFQEELRARWNETKEQLMAETRSYIPEHVAYLSKATKWNYTVWKTLGVDIWPHADAGDTYEEQIAYLENWLEERYVWMDKAINEGDLTIVHKGQVDRSDR